MRILIVEDEPTLGPQLKATLEGAGYAVEADGTAWTVRDPWGTRLRIAPSA